MNQRTTSQSYTIVELVVLDQGIASLTNYLIIINYYYKLNSHSYMKFLCMKEMQAKGYYMVDTGMSR